MDEFWEKVGNGISLLNEWVGKAASWLTLFLVLIVGIDVISRYFFNTTKNWVLELEWYLFATIFLLGASNALKQDKHVRVDLFYSKFSKKDKALVNFWGTLLFLIPWCSFVMISSFNYAYESFVIGERSPNPGGLPALYLIKGMIPLGSFLLLMQGIALLINSALLLRKKDRS